MSRKTNIALLSLGLILSLTIAGLATGKETKSPEKVVATKSFEGENLLVEIEVKYKDSTGSASFVVMDGSSASQLAGGKKQLISDQDKDKQADYKKWGFLFNILPKVSKNGKKVHAQLQIELSRPSEPSSVANIETWQWQSEVKLVMGRKTVIAQIPAHVEITISEVKGN